VLQQQMQLMHYKPQDCWLTGAEHIKMQESVTDASGSIQAHFKQ
jgi:hypothetical protein